MTCAEREIFKTKKFFCLYLSCCFCQNIFAIYLCSCLVLTSLLEVVDYSWEFFFDFLPCYCLIWNDLYCMLKISSKVTSKKKQVKGSYALKYAKLLKETRIYNRNNKSLFHSYTFIQFPWQILYNYSHTSFTVPIHLYLNKIRIIQLKNCSP